MKPNLTRKSKTKKLIFKIWIIIFILLMAISSLFLFSERVHKIAIVDNIKNALTSLEITTKSEDIVKSYTIEWYDVEGNTIKSTETRIGNIGNTVEVSGSDKIVAGYTFDVDNQGNILETILSENGTVLRLYFTKDDDNTAGTPGKCIYEISKVRLTTVPAGIDITGINTDYPVILPEDGSSVTLLYAIVVIGDVGTEYKVTDDGATRVGGNEMEGTIPENGEAVIYVTRAFTIDDIVGDRLENTVEIIPGKGTDYSTNFTEFTPAIIQKPLITLTYTDGVSGKVVFPDQSYEELKEGNKTPKFINDKYTNSEIFEDGTIIPIREGYTFMGWELNGKLLLPIGTVKEEIDSKDVSNAEFNEIIYTAVWEKDYDYYDTEYTIEYYYDNVRDNSRTERINDVPTNNELKEKIAKNEKEGYKFQKLEDYTSSYHVIKVYYVSENNENPVEPEKPTNPETGKRLYTITIENDKSGHTYNSYQVFQGDYYEKEDDEGNKTPILSNIEWGPELQKKIPTENGEGKTHGDKIIELLKAQNPELYNDCKTAEDVAYKLQGNDNDGEVIREFTNVVGKYLLDNNINLTKGTNTLIEEKDIDGNVKSSNYKITELEAGYYIVIDAETKEKDDAYSRYLIDVVQDVTMEVKSSIPTLKKKVIGNNIKNLVEGTGTSEENPAQYVEDEKRNTATYKEESKNYNAEDYDIGFELKSYIPETDSYSKYKFEIVDILAKGFDLDNKSIKVMIDKNEYPKTRPQSEKENYSITSTVISAENYETYKLYFEEEGKKYPQEYRQSQYGKTIILIELNDLVGQMNEGVVKKGQDVIVTYNAKLNGKGEVGTTPNTNEAYLKYSNDPYHSDKQAQTTTQITYTYTIDLILNKIAELKSETDEIKYLSGAEFEIYDGPEYIKEAGSLLPIKNSTRKLIATITTDEIKDAEGNIINEVGHASYNSLAAGTYYLKETKSPEGYNKLREEIKVEINAICDEFGTITWTVEDKEKNKLVRIQIKEKEIVQEKENVETGDITTEVIATIPEVNLQVENTSGFNLPVTGGTGTTIFIVTGLSIMLIAVTFLKSNRKEN